MANPYDNAGQPTREDAFGAPQDKAADVAAQAKDQAADVAAKAKDQAANVAADAKDKASEVASHAGQEAAALRDTASERAGDVIESAKDEVAAVVDEAKQHGQRIFSEGMSELRTQAEQGQVRLAQMVRALTDELQEMVSGTQQNGPMTQFASGLTEVGDRTASWLETRGPQDAVADVRRYAARNPMTFLAAAAGLGLVGSRLARGLRDADAPVQRAPRVAAVDRSHAFDEPVSSVNSPYASRTPYDAQAPAYPRETVGFDTDSRLTSGDPVVDLLGQDDLRDRPTGGHPFDGGERR